MITKPVLNRFPRNHIAAISHYFPGEPVTNKYFEDLPNFDADDAWIQEHTGIKSRYWPDETVERPVEMAVHAVKRALATAQIHADEIDIVIGTTSTTRAGVNPSSLTNRYMDISLPLQPRCGLRNALCFDVSSVACAGFIYATTVAVAMLAALGKKSALVVCAENPKPILNFNYKYSALFGGGASAAVVCLGEGPLEIKDVVLHADGSHFDAFDIDDENKMLVKGGIVGKLGPGMLAAAATELMDNSGLSTSDIDWFVPHQGNLNMIRDVCELTGISDKITLTNIQYRGNTSSVSVPSCLSENLKSGTIQQGDTVLTVAIGRGLSWGGMLINV